jgi:hypothetical protein
MWTLCLPAFCRKDPDFPGNQQDVLIGRKGGHNKDAAGNNRTGTNNGRENMAAWKKRNEE